MPVNPVSRLENITKRIAEISKKIKTTSDKGKLSEYQKELTDLKAELDVFIKEQKDQIKPASKDKGFWDHFMNGLQKITKTKTDSDAATELTKVVLWGNTLKELVGTIICTVQAATNEYLPEDKRMFVAAYDCAVGIVSTTISVVLGVGFMELVKQGCKNALKDAKKSPKYGALLAAFSATVSYMLQTYLGKRIIAPAIGVPVAGYAREKIQKHQDKSKQALVA